MNIKYINSPQNPEIKHLVKLQNPKTRKEFKQCIVEGWRAITTTLPYLKLYTLYSTQENLHKAQELVSPEYITLVTDTIMKKISTSSTPSGIIGIFAIPDNPPIEQLTAGLVLAQIADPGNMGTLIRTAAACAVKTVVIVEGADPWSPKVIQASAGAIALVDIFQLTWDALINSKQELLLTALVVSGGQSPCSIEPNKSLLIVGSEARGIPLDWVQQCDQLITLPMPGGTESLNAAVAGSIALYLTQIKTIC